MNAPAYLLDVNALIALVWDVHSLHGRAHAWFARNRPMVLGCAMTELSFVRVSMADKIIAASFADAELALANFVAGLGDRHRFLDALPPASVLRGGDNSGHRSEGYRREAQPVATGNSEDGHVSCEGTQIGTFKMSPKISEARAAPPLHSDCLLTPAAAPRRPRRSAD